MIVLGIKVSGHDTGVALLRERQGELEIVAITEERLNRAKHSRQYPLMSIDYCLEAFGLESLRQVDVVAIDSHNGSLQGFAGGPSPFPNTDLRPSFNFAVHENLNLGEAQRFNVHHLLAHAASTYYLSPFKDAGVLVVDAGFGMYTARDGELATHYSLGYGTTIENGKPTSRTMARGPGILFNAVTNQLGFGDFGAGKTMALASYGALFEKRDVFEKPENWHDDVIIDYESSIHQMTTTSPMFDPTGEYKGAEAVLSAEWVNLARQTQELLEEDMVFLARHVLEKAKSKNLCLAGGVALSCVTNRRIIDSGVCDQFFIQPAASDEGVPLGCALAAYYSAGGTCRTEMEHAYFGHPNSIASLESTLSRSGMPFRKANDREVAKLLADGRIVGRVFGGSEYGPRALGNRSILADPRRPYMTEILNRRIKHRELFRPFAPSCHADKVNRYFDMPTEGSYMIVAAPVNLEGRSLVPAVVHVDGSCRPQTVRPDQNPAYYNLIEEFGRQTGVFCLINTSFNDKAEPIVETYHDAISSFLRTGLDHLYVDGYLVDRPEANVSLPLEFLSPVNRADVEHRYDLLAEKHCNHSDFVQMLAELESGPQKGVGDKSLHEVA